MHTFLFKKEKLTGNFFPAAIGILDREEVIRTHSENQLGKEKGTDLRENQNPEEAAVAENVLLQEERTTSSRVPETQIHVRIYFSLFQTVIATFKSKTLT